MRINHLAASFLSFFSLAGCSQNYPASEAAQSLLDDGSIEVSFADPTRGPEGLPGLRTAPSESGNQNGLNEHFVPSRPYVEEWCEPSVRYTSRIAACLDCDGECIGVEWPLGASYGAYAFACVSAEQLANNPLARTIAKNGLCWRAGPLYIYCDFMSGEGWQEIYHDERLCRIGPAI